MEKVKVVHLVASIAMGGADQVILWIASSIDRTVFNCRFCLFVDLRRPIPELYEMLQKGNNDLSTVKIRSTIELKQFTQLFHLIRKSRPQVLHTHGYRSDILGLLAAKLIGIPIVSTVHGWTSATRRLRAYEWFHKRCLQYFDMVIAVSEEIRTRLLEAGVSPGKIVTLKNAIDVGAFSEHQDGSSFRRELGLTPGTRVIGTVGRLSVEKGLDYFLKAGAQIIARDPSVKLLVVGEGPQRRELVALAQALGISASVIFCGHRRDVDRIYPAVDLFILPSLTEGIPLALLEAMACSRPIIASKIGGIPEVIQDGVTGLLVPPKDVAQLTEKIWNLLRCPEVGVELGMRARKCVERQFDVQRWIKKIEAIYLGLAHQA